MARFATDVADTDDDLPLCSELRGLLGPGAYWGDKHDNITDRIFNKTRINA